MREVGQPRHSHGHKPTKKPCPTICGTGFSRSQKEVTRPLLVAMDDRQARSSCSERLRRRRSVPLKLGRNFSLRWPLDGRPLDAGSRRGGSRGSSSRSRGSGSRRSRRTGTRSRSRFARLRNATSCRCGRSVTARNCGRRRRRSGLGPLRTPAEPTDRHGQGRGGHRTPQTSHVHRTRSSRRSIRRIVRDVRLKPGRAATHTDRRRGSAAGPAEGPAATLKTGKQSQ